MPAADRPDGSSENSVRKNLGELSAAEFKGHNLTLLNSHWDCIADGPILGDTRITTAEGTARQRTNDSTQCSSGRFAFATSDLITQNTASDTADDRSSGAVVLTLNQNLLALLLRDRHHSGRDLQHVCDFLRLRRILRWVLDLALNLGLGRTRHTSDERG